MRTVFILALLLVPAERLSAGTPGGAGDLSVRPLTPGMDALLRDGIRQSPLIRSAIRRIEASDLVVYLAEVFDSAQPKGKLQFVSAVPGRRYVRVCLARWKLSRKDRLVLLAHELQHAVEVAGAPEVRDLASFAALFRRIGWETRPGHFETEAAGNASDSMRDELEQFRPGLAISAFRPTAGDEESARDSRRIRRDP